MRYPDDEGDEKVGPGRPKLKLTAKEFKKACEFQFTKLEMAAWFDVSDSTIERRSVEWFGENFEQTFKKLSAGGKASLRRKQFQVAMSGSVPMLIWLGKQMLEQRDIVAPPLNEAEIPAPTYVIRPKAVVGA